MSNYAYRSGGKDNCSVPLRGAPEEFVCIGGSRNHLSFTRSLTATGQGASRPVVPRRAAFFYTEHM